MEENVEENIEELEEKFEPKKSKKGVITCILVVLVLLLVCGGLFTYYRISSQPKAILKKFVNKLTIENTEKIPETLKANYKLGFKVNTNDSQSQAIFDEISKCALKTDFQIDFKNKKEIIGTGLMYDNDDVIGAKLIYNSENLYALLEGIYDKYIEIETNDEMKETINKAFETAGKNNNSEDSEEVIKILKNVFVEEIENSKEITQEKITISVKNKDKKVLKTAIKLSTKDLINLLSKFYTELSESKIYADNAEDKQALKEAANQIKETETNSGDYMIIAIYTDGLNNDFRGISISAYVKESDMNLKIELIKEDKNTYKYVVSGDGQGAFINIATGEIKVNSEIKNKEQEKGTFVITAEIPEVVTKSTKINIELRIDYDTKINSPIDTVDTSSSIAMDKISQEDYDLMFERLQEKPLIGPMITSLMEVFAPSDYSDYYDEFEDFDGLDDFEFDDTLFDDVTDTDFTF